jgi:hypothetical protein
MNRNGIPNPESTPTEPELPNDARIFLAAAKSIGGDDDDDDDAINTSSSTSLPSSGAGMVLRRHAHPHTIMTHDSVQNAQYDVDGRIQLPLTIMFRFMWQDDMGNLHPIIGDLVHVDGMHLIHCIRYNPIFPARFNGKYFLFPSKSAFSIKAMEYNGFNTWFFLDQDGCAQTLNYARKIGFRNNSNVVPPHEPQAPAIKKAELLLMTQRAIEINPMTNKRRQLTVAQQSGKRRKVNPNPSHDQRAAAQRAIRHPTSTPQPSSIPWMLRSSTATTTTSWNIGNSALAVVQYLLEVFPGKIRNVRVAWSGIAPVSASTAPSEPQLLTQVMQEQMPPQMHSHIPHEPLQQLSCYMIWSLASKGYVDSLLLATDSQTLDARTKNCSLYPLMCSWSDLTCFRLLPFVISVDSVTMYTADGKIGRSVPITMVLDDIAAMRHVERQVVCTAVRQSTIPMPLCMPPPDVMASMMSVLNSPLPMPFTLPMFQS